jgi:predicted RNA-binding Zn-ribbon protein involved in translation (DUF1610 family)
MARNEYDYYDLEYNEDRTDFKCDGSALRAATKKNPRNLPCPNCGEANQLTREDRAQGYQCDDCADRAERGGEY